MLLLITNKLPVHLTYPSPMLHHPLVGNNYVTLSVLVEFIKS